MKLLIITAPLGNGHNAVAGAISDCFTALYPDASCEILDMYEYISPHLKKETAKPHRICMVKGRTEVRPLFLKVKYM